MNRAILGAVSLAAMSLATSAHASAVITNGTISLGVQDQGHLNVDGAVRPGPNNGFGTGIGVYDNRTGYESTYDGCRCEAWGVANAADGTYGSGSLDSGGVNNLSLVSFLSTVSTATSIVDVIGGASSMQVTHSFAPSISADLYQVVVSITNTGTAAIADLRYRRSMDWDIEPSPFNEYTTIGGVGATALLASSDQGFAVGNPLASWNEIAAGTTNVNFTDSGPADHGAVFDFAFGSLAAGATQTFSIFYGASLSEAGAFTALNAVGAEVYSLGQSNSNIDGNAPGQSTFIFGFKGVGGVVVPPVPGVPEPGTWAMLILGMGMIGGAMRYRRLSLARAKHSVTYA